MKIIRDILVFLLTFCLFITLWAFAFLYTFEQTIENPDFHISILKNLDISQLIYETIEIEISDKIAQDFPSEIPESAKKVVKAKIREIFEANIQDSTYAFFDYISGKTEFLDINIDTKEVKKELKPLALKVLLDTQSKEIRNKFSDTIEREFNLLWDKMMIQIPDSIDGEMILAELDRTDIMENLEAWAEVQKIISQVYYISIVLIIGMIFLIVLLQWEIRKSLLLFGALFLLSGGILILPLFFFNSHLVLSILSDSVIPQVNNHNIPAYVIILLKDIIDGLMSHLRVILLGFILIGITSMVGSLILKSNKMYNSDKKEFLQ